MSIAKATLVVSAALSFAVMHDSFALDPSKQLALIEPDYPSPRIEILGQPGDQETSPVLLGISLEQSGGRVRGDEPLVDGETPLTVVAHWRSRQSSTKSFYAGSLVFWDSLGLMLNKYEILIGPSKEEQEWHFGGVYQTRHEVDMKLVSRRFSGDVSLVVQVQGSSGDMRPRQLLSFHVSPLLQKSSIGTQEVNDALGDKARFIDARLRMGRNAQKVLDINEKWRKGNRRLAVLSRILYRLPAEGSVVCEITLNPSEPNESVLYLLSGVHTSLAVNGPGTNESPDHAQKARVFKSEESHQLTADGQFEVRNTYIAILELPEELESLESLSISCVAPTAIDVLGFALLPE